MKRKYEKPREPLRPHSKNRQNLRERLMREYVDRRIEERRETAPKASDPMKGGAEP